MSRFDNLEVYTSPGCWVVAVNGKKGKYAHRYSIMAIGEESIRVADIIRMDAGSAGLRSLADAVLMAASKQLLFALRGLVDLHCCEQEGLSCGMPTPEEWEAAVELAEQAISDATTYKP